jgi:class 3 adenylate cyclase
MRAVPTPTESLAHRLEPLRASGRFAPSQLDAAEAWVSTAPDEALFRINPLAFAAEQGWTELNAIDFFVLATRYGLFDFAWGLICPSCSAFINSRGGLQGVAEGRHCELCDVDAGQVLDDGVEVSFTVAPAVRRIRFHGEWSSAALSGDQQAETFQKDLLKLYFSSAITRKLETLRHAGIRAVAVTPLPKQGVELKLQVDQKARWKVLAPGIHAVAALEVVAGGPDTAAIEFFAGSCVPASVKVGPGRVTLQLAHRADQPELLVAALRIGDAAADALPPEAPPHFLTGRRLLSNQTFRDEFRTERLGDDASLEIRSLAMLFTDLKSSTQMYERIGDLRALALVREHFEKLRRVVAAHEGAVVKTIGDAVMATFNEPSQAVAAAIEMHRVLRTDDPDPLQLKVGLHLGSCVAVDSNERLDFFGQTVNIAARVQALADGEELVLTEAVRVSPGVLELLAASKLTLTREEAQLKGIARPMVIHRTHVG